MEGTGLREEKGRTRILPIGIRIGFLKTPTRNARIFAALLVSFFAALPVAIAYAGQPDQGQSSGGVQWSPSPAPSIAPSQAIGASPAAVDTLSLSQTPNQPTKSPGQGSPLNPSGSAGIPTPGPESQAAPDRTASFGKPGLVSFNFDDADVYSVIQTIFGEALKVNYVIDPGSKAG